ncbi:MAG: transcription antitermination factor NusB [Bacillota bacterium]|nr:transcription antitermination factor NusB [Bacillota bacterium]
MKTKRIRSREVAMEILYQMQFRPSEQYANILLQYVEEELDQEYLSTVLDFVSKNSEEYDRKIAEHLVEWKLERLSRLERSILRLALAEIYGVPEIDFRVTVAEAVELAKRYCDEKSGRFINGLLRNFEHEKPA